MKIEHPFDFDPTHGYTLDDLRRQTAPEEKRDFADFWRTTYREATAGKPEYAVRELWSGMENCRLYEIRAMSFGNVPVTMYLSRPERSAGAIVYGQGYGNGVQPIQDKDFTVIIAGSRGLGPSRTRNIPWEVRKHVVFGLESRKTYVWRGVIADLWLSASVLLDMFPDAAENLNYRGGSMGGAIGALALPWDRRFRAACLAVPTFGNHPLRVTLPCTGSGKGVSDYWEIHPECLDVLAYFDAAVAAKHLTVSTICEAAKFDPMVPPAGQFAVLNSIPGNLCRPYIVEAGHWDCPEDRPVRLELDAEADQLFLRPHA